MINVKMTLEAGECNGIFCLRVADKENNISSQPDLQPGINKLNLEHIAMCISFVLLTRFFYPLESNGQVQRLLSDKKTYGLKLIKLVCSLLMPTLLELSRAKTLA